MTYLAKNYNRKKISFKYGKGSYLYSNNISSDNKEDVVKKLTELKELHEKKILTDEEFATAKKKILGE